MVTEPVPMMVIIRTSPAMKYSMAVCSPPKINQIIFPNSFMFVLFQSLSVRRRNEAKSCKTELLPSLFLINNQESPACIPAGRGLAVLKWNHFMIPRWP